MAGHTQRHIMAQELEEEGLGLLFQSANGEAWPGVSRRVKLKQKAAENSTKMTSERLYILEPNSFSISGSHSL